VNADVFLQNLRESQLLSKEQRDRVQARVEAQGLDTAMVGELIKEGTLTSYQVGQLEIGRGKGLVLGQYRILEEVGRGGFGCVYKAAHVLMDRIVALKLIAPERVEDDRARSMFLREVRAATRLHHPNIALAYDAGEVEGRLFLAMEFVEGPNLDQLVRKQGPLPLNLAWPMLQQAAQALRCANDEGLVHRDVKPANLLIPQAALAAAARSAADAPALVKVVDFGLARLQSPGTSGTLFPGKEKAFAGTPDFVSPEQARSLHDVDIRSDLYSLGCTFYYALAGRKPFQGATPLEIVLQHIEKEPDPLEYLRPELPPALAGFIRRLMEKRPDKRFQSPNELLAEMGFLSISGSQSNIALPSWPSLALDRSVASSPQFALAPVGPTPRKSGMLPRPAIDAEAKLPTTMHLPAVDRQIAALQADVVPEAAPPSADETAAATLVSLETHDESVPVGPPLAAVPPDGALLHAWDAWHAVLAAVAIGTAPPIAPADYKTLHASLLRALRAGAQGDASRHDHCQRLESLVEPWVSLQILAATDPATLRDLMVRSRRIAHALGACAAPVVAVPRWLTFALLTMLALAVGAISSLQLAGGRVTWHAPSLQSAWLFVQANPVVSLTLLLPATVLVAFYGLSRLAFKNP
jgi:eukaryotic-like serine/threonine-protein kinase